MLKSVAWVSFGTIGTQAISFVSTPILTRIYGPAEYGVYATLIALSTVLTLVSTLRLDLAIDLPPKVEESRQIATLCLWLALLVNIIAIVLSLFALLTLDRVQQWAESTVRSPYLLYLVPVLSLLGVWANLIAAYHFRNLQFKDINIRRILNAFIDVAMKLSLSLTPLAVAGLMLGSIASSATFILQIKRIAIEQSSNIWQRLSLDDAKNLLKKYQQFPKYGLPTVLINHFYSTLPIWVVGAKFGPEALGLLYIAQRLCQIPELALSAPVAQVFRRYAAQQYREGGECRKLFLKTALSLVGAGAVLMLPIFLFAETILSLLFGSQWAAAASAVQILAITGFMQFALSPLTTMFVVAGRQRSDFLLSASALSAGCIAAWWAITGTGTIESLLWSLLVVHSMKYLAEVLMSYRLACGLSALPALVR